MRNEYSYNCNANNNRLTSISETGENFTYNNRGDLITETGGYTFAYDVEGRLEEVKQITGSDTNKFNFQYTSEGRRLRKVYYRDSSGVIEADTTYYIYDGMNVVAELDKSLDLKSKYVYTNGMLVANINADDELFQYFHDGLGSITMICDSTGEYQNLYVYDDFGSFRMLEEAGSVPNHYYYTGQERDESPSGLYNLRARYYAAGIGRFTQEDPVFGISGLAVLGGCGGTDILIDNPNGTNLYLYAFNNPMRYTDITGLGACEDLANCLGAALSKYEKRGKDCSKQLNDCMNNPCIDYKRVCIIEAELCHRRIGRARLSDERQCYRQYRRPCIWEKIAEIGGAFIPFKYLNPFLWIPPEEKKPGSA